MNKYPLTPDNASIRFDYQICPVIFNEVTSRHLLKAVHEVKYGYWTRQNAADYLTKCVLKQVHDDWQQFADWINEMTLHRINCELN